MTTRKVITPVIPIEIDLDSQSALSDPSDLSEIPSQIRDLPQNEFAEKFYSIFRSFMGQNKSNISIQLEQLCHAFDLRQNFSNLMQNGFDHRSVLVRTFSVSNWHLFIKTAREQCGVDLHFDNEYLLSKLLRFRKNTELIKYLLQEEGCNFNLCYQIHHPTICKSPALLKVLIEQHFDLSFLFDPNEEDNHFGYFMAERPLSENYSKVDEVLRLLIADGYRPDSQTVQLILEDGNVKTARFLFEAGLIVEYDQSEALYKAMQADHHEMLKLLFEHGAKFDWDVIDQKQSQKGRQTISILQDHGCDLMQIIRLFNTEDPDEDSEGGW